MIYKKLFNNAQIETWFPKSIYILPELKKEKLKIYEDYLKNLNIKTKRTDIFEVESSHDILNLHKSEIFKDLFENIFDNCKIFLKELGYVQKIIDNLKIENSWYNISYEGDYLQKHIHPNSLLSGVYYIKSNDDDFITFFDNDDMLTSYPENNYLNFKSCKYKCAPGNLLLFKSNLNHSTNKQKGKEKIVISFNI